jgi:hypothetical protein
METNVERVFYTRRPVATNGAGVVSYTALFIILAGGGAYGLLSAMETGDGRWLALLIASVVGVIVAGWRVRQHDERAFVEEERSVAPLKPEAPKTIKSYTHMSLGGGKMTVGRFSFTQAQWHALRSAIITNGDKLLRDPVRRARPMIFESDDINNWSGIVEEFQRIGVIDAKQNLTDTGRKFLAGDPFTTPLPHPAAMSANGRYGGGGERGEEDLS